MVVLIIFGFIAGAATAASPCILPGLPVALAAGGRLSLRFGAKKAFLVLGPPGRPRELAAMLDGKPIGGADAAGSKVTVTDQRLYELVDLPEAGEHTLTLTPESGVEAYAFTFG